MSMLKETLLASLSSIVTEFPREPGFNGQSLELHEDDSRTLPT